MTKIIDCTIRDGGHLNGWNFSDEFVFSSYAAACDIGADYFEIGYRYKNHDPSWEKWARVNEKIISQFPTLNPKLMIMAHATKSDPEDFIGGNYAVRVATRTDVLKQGMEFCENLSEKGYEVFLNLTEALRHDFNQLNNWHRKDIPICIADSLGEMTPDDVVRLADKLQDFEKLCFHAHGKNALVNTLKAIELGFYSVDAAQNTANDNLDIYSLLRSISSLSNVS
jgi:4-hydroxy 2-oxovalerate aldolase